MAEETPQHHPNPTAVLRGGPFDGLRVRQSGFALIAKETHDRTTWVYRPTGEMDEEYPELSLYVLDHGEPA